MIKNQLTFILVLALTLTQTAGAALSRKYPPLSLECDTLFFRRGEAPRGLHQAEIPFIQDREVLEILDLPFRTHYFTDLHYKTAAKVSPTGKHVLQQQALRGCTAAVSAMLVADHGKTPNLSSLYNRNLGSDFEMLRDLEESGLKGTLKYIGTAADSVREYFGVNQISPVHINAQPENAFAALEEEIRRDGPAILSVGGEIGGHVIIVDEINLQKSTATLRDPYHGWMIRVQLVSLARRARPPFTVIQVSRHN